MEKKRNQEVVKEKKDNVIQLSGITTLDLPPDRVLEQAIGNLESVIIIGYDKDGYEYFASNKADGGFVMWLLERCKLQLLRVGGS